MFGKVSLGSVGLVVGGILTLVGFVAYGVGNPTLNLIGFFYGIPVLLGGLALKAAELQPVPFSQMTSPELLSLREQKATPTQNQIRKDVTRYRYGQSTHLESSLESLGLHPNDEDSPVLKSIREANVDGDYALILEFDSPELSFEVWQAKREKIERFFGPGVRVELTPADEGQVDVALIATLEAIA